MKILLASQSFHPAIGGIEAVSWMLADEFLDRGHDVTVVTETEDRSPMSSFRFPVVRRPAALQLIGLIRRCDVYLQNHINVRMLWPLLFVPRPLVIANHTWVPQTGVKGWFRRLLLARVKQISCSHAVAARFPAPSTVIQGPYNDGIFRELAGTSRDRDLILVGRLVESKGAHLLLDAMSLLAEEGLRPCLTIVGGGPEEDPLKQLAKDRGLVDQVVFAGPQPSPEVSQLLNRHRIMVVPSLWSEPFGIVALEGIACGCSVVVSEGGGLREALGPCGATFPNGDTAALAAHLAAMLRNPGDEPLQPRERAIHLKKFTRAAVADAYLAVLRSACDGC